MSDRVRYRDLHPEKFPKGNTPDRAGAASRRTVRQPAAEKRNRSASMRHGAGEQYRSKNVRMSADEQYRAPEGHESYAPAMYRRGANISSGRGMNSFNYDDYDEHHVGKRGKRPEKPDSHIGLILGIAVPIFLIAAIVAVFVSLKAQKAADEAGGGDRSTEDVVITIDEGSSAKDVAQILGDAGIIEYTSAFYKYAKNNDYATNFQYGEFTVTQAMSYQELCEVLTANVVRTDFVDVNFPEGFTIMQIAARLESNGVCGADEFIDTLQNTDSFGFDFESEIVQDDLRIFKYEGYLLPATYQFYLDSTPEEVIDKMFTAFESFYEEYKDEIDSSGYTLDEIVTLASVIQRESFDEDSMAKVSSVFHNRLDIGMALQSDATRDFLDTYDEYDISYTAEQADAYDTYQVNALPVGPINNPGKEAIIAALEPADTPYFYFWTDADGNYYWAETYDEHLENQRLYGE